MLLFNNDETMLLSTKEVYDKLENKHGTHQVRKALERLDDQGILFKEVRNHNLHLYRVSNRSQQSDRMHTDSRKIKAIIDIPLQEYAESLFKRFFLR
jgi:UTP-glucose-1-phosphate uridylyltransferase